MKKNGLVFTKNLKGGRRDFIVGVVDDDAGVFIPAGELEFARGMDGGSPLREGDLLFVRRIRWIRCGAWDDVPERAGGRPLTQKKRKKKKKHLSRLHSTLSQSKPLTTSVLPYTPRVYHAQALRLIARERMNERT